MKNLFLKSGIVALISFVPLMMFSQNIERSKEDIIDLKISSPYNSYGGYYSDHPAYLFFNRKNDSVSVEIKYLNEEKRKFFDSGMTYTVQRRTSSSYMTHNSYFFYRKMNFESPEDYGYNALYLSLGDKTYFLDSIYNADKKIHSSFSSDGRYLLVNTFNTLSDYYNSEQDNRIMVYDLENIEKGKIKKEYIPCMYCSDSYLVDDTLFFTIGRKDGYENFSNKDIYMAPWENLQDMIKVASNTEIKSISPDGKYILGTRFWDLQKNTDVIVDVKDRKYQMLLGRDYAKQRAFYSYHKEKFSYDFKGYIIYVDYPESYPFDALNWRNEGIPDWTDEEFWKQYEHPPLLENK